MENDKVKPESNCFIDPTFGKKGGWAWLVPVGVVAIIYQLFILARGYFSGYINVPVMIVIFTALFFIVLLLTAVLFLIQGMKTAQRIEYRDGLFTMIFYYGRVIKVPVKHIERVGKSRAPWLLKNFITPLGRGGENYKVNVKDEPCFYISATMPGVCELIDLINLRE